VAPSMLGKRHRDSDASNVTGIIEEGQEGQLSEEELAKTVLRPMKKRPKMNNGMNFETAGHEDPSAEEHEEEESQQPAPRVPSFTVFRGEEEPYIDPPPPTESLPDFFPPASLDSESSARQSRITSTQHASENQHPFNFSFLPTSSTPNNIYALPSFPYPEAPESPSPAGGSRPNNAFLVGRPRNDIFQSFGLPPPGRSARAEATDTSSSQGACVNPAALTRTVSDRERDPDNGFGLPVFKDELGSAPTGLKRTMYGTELDGDTRFGDFGLEGVASGMGGFWAGGRF